MVSVFYIFACRECCFFSNWPVLHTERSHLACSISHNSNSTNQSFRNILDNPILCIHRSGCFIIRRKQKQLLRKLQKPHSTIHRYTHQQRAQQRTIFSSSTASSPQHMVVLSLLSFYRYLYCSYGLFGVVSLGGGIALLRMLLCKATTPLDERR